MTRLSRTAILATVATLSLAACSREAEAPVANADMGMTNDMMVGNDMMAEGMAGAAQSFNFAGPDGKALGSVSVSEDASGLMLAVSATGMPAGVHGIHFHAKGLCDGPKFESAGAHWNPGAKQHGRDNPQGAHLGDLANLEVAGAGTATAKFTVAGAMIKSGANMLADADGTALVIHAKADDYKTDPSGDSGDRIACAVLAPPL